MKYTFFLLAPCLLLASCASIVSKSQYPVSISSNPSGTKVAVKNSNGQVIHQASTPTTVSLKSSQGYFKPASYTFEFTKKNGTKQSVPVSARMDGWYVGNVVFGGLIGFLIVDPLTGAMWKLDDKVHADLVPLATLDNGRGQKIAFVDKATLPITTRKTLVAIHSH
ncbi:MAG: hypothetical protein QM627_07545 [Luteolibacter sp.]